MFFIWSSLFVFEGTFLYEYQWWNLVIDFLQAPILVYLIHSLKTFARSTINHRSRGFYKTDWFAQNRVK